MRMRDTFVQYMLFAALLALVAISDHVRSANRRACELQQAQEYSLRDALWQARARSLLPGD
jgi:hypothetical protein